MYFLHQPLTPHYPPPCPICLFLPSFFFFFLSPLHIQKRLIVKDKHVSGKQGGGCSVDNGAMEATSAALDGWASAAWTGQGPGWEEGGCSEREGSGCASAQQDALTKSSHAKCTCVQYCNNLLVVFLGLADRSEGSYLHPPPVIFWVQKKNKFLHPPLRHLGEISSDVID